MREDIWRFVARAGVDDCWLWIGGKSPDGYGKFSLSGATLRAHRVAYESATGPIPAGMLVCHACDVPLCCNPAHLFLGDVLANNRDREAKGRSAPQHGEHSNTAKLTNGQVAVIVAMDTARVRHADIGAYFGVNRQTVSKIVNGHRWSRATGLSPGGEGHRNAKLTRTAVARIMKLRAHGISQRYIAHTFKISEAQVSRIVHGKQWKEIA